LRRFFLPRPTSSARSDRLTRTTPAITNGRSAADVFAAICFGEMVVGGEVVEGAALAGALIRTQVASATPVTNATRRNTHPPAHSSIAYPTIYPDNASGTVESNTQSLGKQLGSSKRHIGGAP
jgi:hypothetical protein